MEWEEEQEGRNTHPPRTCKSFAFKTFNGRLANLGYNSPPGSLTLIWIHFKSAIIRSER